MIKPCFQPLLLRIFLLIAVISSLGLVLFIIHQTSDLWEVDLAFSLVNAASFFLLIVTLLLLTRKCWRTSLFISLLIMITQYQSKGSYLSNQFANRGAFCQNKFHILQFNLSYFSHAYKSLLTHLESKNYDLIALQEVSPNQGRLLITQLKEKYPYQIGGTPVVGFPSGQLLFSKSPFIEFQVHGDQGKNQLISALWQTSNYEPVHLITAHAPSPRSHQLWQQRNHTLERIEQLFEHYALPSVMVIGDLNIPPNSDYYQNTFQKFQGDPVISWPNIDYLGQFIGIAIDHLLVSSSLTLCHREPIVELEYSDHFAIASSVSFKTSK